MKKGFVYIQSGGPTAVINSSLYGAIMEAKKHTDKIEGIYGSLNGIEGLLNDRLIDLEKEDAETIELFKQTPGAILGTTRYKLPQNLHDEQYNRIITTLNKHNIGYVFVNGGNDSMDTCHKLHRLCEELKLDIKVIGIPKTVDNDLAVTDHSLGYGSAAKYVINTVKEICIDASCYKKGKVFVIEIMGRNAGWLTASVDLLPSYARPDLIFLPENVFDLEKFLQDIKTIYEKQGHAIAAISEGIIFERDTSSARVDAFNHVQLGGAADALTKIIEKRLDLPTRSIELSLAQRAYCVLLSKVDQDEAIACGAFGVKAAVSGESGKMVVITRISDEPYVTKLELADISQIANEEKMIPSSMMSGQTKMDVSFERYLRPLIQGEVSVKYEDGIIASARLKKVLI